MDAGCRMCPSPYGASGVPAPDVHFLCPISPRKLAVFLNSLDMGGKRKPHTGPPIAPRITASALMAAASASSVNGDPVASIDACNEPSQHEYNGMTPAPCGDHLLAYSRHRANVPETRT